ncbi:VirB8/TrbF family protein [Pseudoroseomonas sp. WGS1072]|uniref:VirB8/TrbF family protein n=1 Tax=Roseomonas sp. WGS1072 TaxID=3366816 RepID=UPI003BF204D6
MSASSAPEEAMAAFRTSSTAAVVSPEQAAAHYQRILQSQAASQRRDNRRSRMALATSLSQIAVSLALAGAVVFLLAREKTQIVYVAFNSDGTFRTSASERDLTTSDRRAAMSATLWRYVAAREGYSSAGHPEAQQFVYILSDKAVGDAYQASVDPRNEQSPFRVYGTRTQAQIERRTENLFCIRDAALEGCGGRDPDSYKVWFTRTQRTEGQRAVRRNYSATIRFRAGVKVPSWQLVTHNPLGLQVTEYSITEEGAMP